MRIKLVTIGIAAAFIGLLWSAGCGKSEPPKETSSHSAESTTPQAQQHMPPSEGGEAVHHDEHGGSAEPMVVAPSGSSAELWNQISAEQTKMESVIRTGHLADVHHIAFAIRDLSVAAAGKASAPSATNAAKIQDTLDQIKKSASTLDEYGDSGNLGGVKQEYTLFQQEITTLKSLVGAL